MPVPDVGSYSITTVNASQNVKCSSVYLIKFSLLRCKLTEGDPFVCISHHGISRPLQCLIDAQCFNLFNMYEMNEGATSQK